MRFAPSGVKNAIRFCQCFHPLLGDLLFHWVFCFWVFFVLGFLGCSLVLCLLKLLLLNGLLLAVYSLIMAVLFADLPIKM